MKRLQAHQIEGLDTLTSDSSGGGAWQAPLVDYSPAATPTVVDDSTASHVAFPSSVTLRDGRHVVTYRTASGHHWTSTGAARCKVSTDNGATWSAATTILDNSGGDDNPQGVTQLHDDRILALVVVRPTSTVAGWYTVSTRSADATTWDTPVTVDAGFSGFSYASDAATLADGTVLAALYGEDTGSGDDYAVVAASTDGGTAWGRRGVIAKTAGVNWQEPRLVLMPDGEILAFLRYQTGSTYRIHLARSMDNGATWTSPAQILTDASGMPAAHLTRNGALVLAYRNKAVSDTCLWAVSKDRGNTWTVRGNFSAVTNRSYVYADWLDLADGDLGLVYALEDGVAGSGSNADLYFRRFTRELDETLPLGHLDTAGASEGDSPKIVGGTVTWQPAAGPTTTVHLPLTTVVNGEPVLVWGADDSLIPTEVPL